MALEIERITKEFNGDGASRLFAFDIPTPEPTDLRVVRIDGNGTEYPLALGVDFTAAINRNLDGLPLSADVTLTAPVPVGWKLSITRNVPLEQTFRFEVQQRIPPKRLEQSLDYLTMICQQLFADILTRASPEDIQAILDSIAHLYNTKANIGDPPTRHAASHALNGSDPISITAVGGVAFNDPKLYDARPPLAHAWRHRPDGDDPLYLNALGGVTLEQFNAAVVNLQRQLDRKMPTAPTDGYGWLGAGSSWKRWLIDTGPLFIKDEYGFTVMVQRPQYAESSVWKIEEPFAVLNPDRRPGDSDNAFMVDEFGFTVLKR